MSLLTEPLYVGVELAAIVLGIVIAFTHPNRRNMLSFLLGVSAGLVGVQIFRIHVFTILAVVWAFLPQGARDRSAAKHLAAMLVASLLLASTTLLGDLVNSPTLGLQILGLAGSAAIVAVRATRHDVKALLWGLLVVSTIGSAVGVLQVFRVIPMELWHMDISAIGRPTGIYPEPDWLGMFAGVGVLLSWRLSMSQTAKVGFSLANITVFILAMARASWLAFLVCVVAAWIASSVLKHRHSAGTAPAGPRRGRRTALVVASVAALVALSAVPQLQEDLTLRVSTMIGTVQEDDISGQARIRQNDALMELARSVPAYGHGLSAAGRVGVWGQIDAVGESQNNVASNWVLGMWVDGAWFALPLALFLIGLSLARGRTIPGQLLLFCLVCSLFSNAVFFPVTWLLVGLSIIASPSHAERQLPLARGATPMAPTVRIPVLAFTRQLVRATTTSLAQLVRHLRIYGPMVGSRQGALRGHPRHRLENRVL